MHRRRLLILLLPLLLLAWLLVACDGLHGQLDDRTIQGNVSKVGPAAALLVNRLADLANQSGGTDNCTIVAVRCY